MAKGLLFALVRKGSKLNYLDDGNNQTSHENKHSNERVKPHIIVNSNCRQIEHKARKLCSTQQIQLARGKAESKQRSNRLFDMTFQKLSKGCKTHRNSPACSTTDGSLRQIDSSKSDYPCKPTVAPSVASGYFVREISSNNRNEPSKMGENGTRMPSIVLTDHDPWNSATSKRVETNVARIQYYSRYSSFPILRANERTKRPSSWNGEDSSPQLSHVTNRRSRPGSPDAESLTSSLSYDKSSGLYIEAIPISLSPSMSRRNIGSAHSLRPLRHDLNRTHSTVDRRSKGAESSSVKMASSWSRGDEKIAGFHEKHDGGKIDIFLPSM